MFVVVWLIRQHTLAENRLRRFVYALAWSPRRLYREVRLGHVEHNLIQGRVFFEDPLFRVDQIAMTFGVCLCAYFSQNPAIWGHEGVGVHSM